MQPIQRTKMKNIKNKHFKWFLSKNAKVSFGFDQKYKINLWNTNFRIYKVTNNQTSASNMHFL